MFTTETPKPIEEPSVVHVETLHNGTVFRVHVDKGGASQMLLDVREDGTIKLYKAFLEDVGFKPKTKTVAGFRYLKVERE